MGEGQQVTAGRLLSFPQRLCLALALALLSWWASGVWFVPFCLSNDDIVMEMLARGIGLASHPTPYLIFVNVWLGKLLVLLNHYWPAVSWYRVLMTGTHLASSTTIAYVALSWPLSTARLMLLAGFFLVFDFLSHVRWHFTVIASLAALAGILLWLQPVAADRPLGRCRLVLFVSFQTLAAMLRLESYQLMTLAALPLLAIYGCGLGSRRLTLRQICWRILPFGVAGLLALGTKAANDWEYARTAGWSDFYEFNRLRAEFVDYHRATYDRRTRWIFEEAGWSQNDYSMLKEWFFEDPHLYNINTFRQILAHFPPVSYRWADQMLKEFKNTAAADADMQLMLGEVLFLFVCVGRKRTRFALVLSTWWMAVLGCSLMLFKRRFPLTIYMPQFAFLAGIALALPTAPLRPRLSRLPGVLQGIGFLLILALFARAVVQVRSESENVRALNQQLRSTLAGLHPRPDDLYVIFGGNFPFELLVSSDDLEMLRPFKMLGTGFLSQTPVNRDRLAEFGIDDLYTALVHRPATYLISHPNFNTLFRRYILEHYHEQVDAETVLLKMLGHMRGFSFDLGQFVLYSRSVEIYRFRTHPPATPPAQRRSP